MRELFDRVTRSLAISLCLMSGWSNAAAAEVEQEAATVLAMGNSISLHGPSAKLGWTHRWGMAASSQDKDYLSQLVAGLHARGRDASFKVVSIVDLERGRKSAADLIVSLPEKSPWLLVVQGGDNVPKTAAARQAFLSEYEHLLAGVRSRYGDAPALRCVGLWWGWRLLDSKLSALCQAAGGQFIPLSDVSAEPRYNGSLDHPLLPRGVQQHPGDAGMAVIAARILDSLP